MHDLQMIKACPTMVRRSSLDVWNCVTCTASHGVLRVDCIAAAGCQGSVQLRSLAHAQHRLMQFFRVTVAKKSGASSDVVSAWAEKLRVRRAELQPPCLVFLRGPGAPPVVSGCTLYFSFFTLAMTAGAI